MVEWKDLSPEAKKECVKLMIILGIVVVAVAVLICVFFETLLGLLLLPIFLLCS